MSASKNSIDAMKTNNTKGGDALDKIGKYSKSSDAKDDFTVESEEKDPLDVSKEEAVSGAEQKKPTSATEDRDEVSTKIETSKNAQQKDQKEKKNEPSVPDGEKETVSSTKKSSPEDNERAKSLLKGTGSPSGPIDLLYLFQKYADEEEATKGTEKITLKLLKKWLKQAKLFDEEAGITEEYAADLFKKSASETDLIDFEEFQAFLYSMAEEKNQSYSELTHKVLSAGKPHIESIEPEDLQNTIENSMEKIATTDSSEEQFKEKSESESSDSSTKAKE